VTAKRVLCVGQCAADSWSISRTLEKAFSAELVSVATAAEALDRMRQETFPLVLVNRVFDANGASGLDLIRRVKADAELSTAPVMLVSNYADAQREAQAAGAEPGFGKASLGRADMLDRVRAFLGDDC